MESPSVHFYTERQGRDAFITNQIGIGSVVDTFVVDRGHPGGAELHSVTDTASIIIHNLSTNKLITELILERNASLNEFIPPTIALAAILDFSVILVKPPNGFDAFVSFAFVVSKTSDVNTLPLKLIPNGLE